ncbi:hypothetical protein GIB67_016028, partial [Kingdonia uniflora]
ILASTVEFTKILIDRDYRFSITVLIMPLPFANTSTTYIESIANTITGIRFIELPIVHPPPLTKPVLNQRGSFSEPQVKAIAIGLERCGNHFLWALRRPPVEKFGMLTDCANFKDVLQAGFLDRTSERVKILGLAVELRVNYINGVDLVTAEEIERGVKFVMDNDSIVRRKITVMKEISQTTKSDRGSSFASLRRFIQDVTE